MADGQDGLWLTEFKGGEGKSDYIYIHSYVSVNLLTSVVDTDYDNWAVFVQCIAENGEDVFLSTR